MIWSHPTRPRRPWERVHPKIAIEPKKSCISIYLRFFAEPNEPKEPKFDALIIKHRCQPPPVTPLSTFFSSPFQSFTDPKIGLPPAPMLTSNRRDAYPTQTPRPPSPTCSRGPRPSVTKSPAIPATKSQERTYPYTTNTPSSRTLRHNAPAAPLSHFAPPWDYNQSNGVLRASKAFRQPHTRCLTFCIPFARDASYA
jgi:hypothetical protein